MNFVHGLLTGITGMFILFCFTKIVFGSAPEDGSLWAIAAALALSPMRQLLMDSRLIVKVKQD